MKALSLLKGKQKISIFKFFMFSYDGYQVCRLQPETSHRRDITMIFNISALGRQSRSANACATSFEPVSVIRHLDDSSNGISYISFIIKRVRKTGTTLKQLIIACQALEKSHSATWRILQVSNKLSTTWSREFGNGCWPSRLRLPSKYYSA